MTDPAGDRVLPRWLVVLLGVAATVIAVAGVRSAADVVAPVFLALMLIIAVHPVLTWARRHGAPTWLALTLALLVLYAVVIGLVLTLGVSVARLATLLPEYQEEIDGLLDDVGSLLTSLGIGQDEVDRALAGVDPESVLGFVGGLVSGLLDAVSNLLFVLATVLFMGVDAGGLPDRLRSVPGASPALTAALGGFARSTRSYLVVSTVFGLVVAVVDTVALFLLGIPLPILWGLLSWITNYVPNIGFVIGLVPPALLALLVDGPGLALVVVVVYSVANFVIQSIIQPAVVGDAVGLSVTVTFLSLVAWTWILGPLGALLALPLTLLVKAVLLDADPGREWARTLVSSPPPRPGRRARRRPGPDAAAPGLPAPGPDDAPPAAPDGRGPAGPDGARPAPEDASRGAP
ncbi:AI-2E family transporter [Geodermatophilus sp. SYSU D00710]